MRWTPPTRPASNKAVPTKARRVSARRRNRAGTAPICAIPPATRSPCSSRPDLPARPQRGVDLALADGAGVGQFLRLLRRLGADLLPQSGGGLGEVVEIL